MNTWWLISNTYISNRGVVSEAANISPTTVVNLPTDWFDASAAKIDLEVRTVGRSVRNKRMNQPNAAVDPVATAADYTAILEEKSPLSRLGGLGLTTNAPILVSNCCGRAENEVGQNVAVEQYKGFFAQHWQRLTMPPPVSVTGSRL